MSRMKKLVSTIIIIVGFTVAIWHFGLYCPPQNTPIKFTDPANDVSFLRFTYHLEETPIDEERLMKILSKYEAKHTWKRYFPYSQEGVLFEIDYIENQRPVHILLGEEFDIIYESADQDAYDIIDAQQLKQDILDIME